MRFIKKKKIKNKIGVVIFGQGWIAIEIIKYILASKKYCLKSVVANKYESVFDASLKLWCEQNKIKVINPNSRIKSLEKKKDVGISITFNNVLKSNILKKFNFIFNCHYSVLPKYRGMNPIHWALKKKDILGFTIHQIDEGIDTGKIIYQKKFKKRFTNSFDATNFLYKKSFIAYKKVLNNLDFYIKKTKLDLKKKFFNKSKKVNLYTKKDFSKLKKYKSFFYKRSRYQIFRNNRLLKSILVVSRKKNPFHSIPLDKKNTMLFLLSNSKNFFYHKSFRFVLFNDSSSLERELNHIINNNVFFDLIYVDKKILDKKNYLLIKIGKKIKLI